MRKILRKAYVKYLVWRGKAIDIWSNEYPSGILSNLSNNGFEFDGIECKSMEGFLQSLKYSDPKVQKSICFLKGKKAKSMTKNNAWKLDMKVYWQGRTINRLSDEFQLLIRHAYNSLYEQNIDFRTALLLTRGKTLYHMNGKSDPTDTILTEREFCSILTELRDGTEKKWQCYLVCGRESCPFRKP